MKRLLIIWSGDYIRKSGTPIQGKQMIQEKIALFSVFQLIQVHKDQYKPIPELEELRKEIGYYRP